MTLKESPRLNKPNCDESKSNELDYEVYDDRQFYSMLLKSFITSSSAVGISDGLRENDLQELRKYRKKNENVNEISSIVKFK